MPFSVSNPSSSATRTTRSGNGSGPMAQLIVHSGNRSTEGGSKAGKKWSLTNVAPN